MLISFQMDNRFILVFMSIGGKLREMFAIYYDTRPYNAKNNIFFDLLQNLIIFLSIYQYLNNNLYICTKLKIFEMDNKLNRIKVVMAEKDKTGLWLSKQIGKSNTTVSKYINQRVQPDLKTLYAIADALEVDVKELLLSNR